MIKYNDSELMIGVYVDKEAMKRVFGEYLDKVEIVVRRPA